jgi:stearoyl-CoA desaturase (delta-9 desaturase)
MILLTRRERVRAVSFVKVMASGITLNQVGRSPQRRLASLVYSFEIFAPYLYVLLLPTAHWSGSLFLAGLLIGTCLWTWLGVMLYLHRYLSHRSFRIREPRLEKFLELFAVPAMQGYPLTWAFMHRRHHQAADTERDPHSPLHASALWIYSLFKIDYSTYIPARDYPAYQAAFPARLRGVSHEEYLARVDRHAMRSLAVQAALFLVLMMIGGWSWVVYLQFLPVVVVHLEVCVFINVFSHRFGYRNFELAGDRATNHFSAGLTISEWQNNHHRYLACASNRVRFWEIDVLYLILLAWRRLGWVSDLVERSSLQANRVEGEEVA